MIFENKNAFSTGFKLCWTKIHIINFENCYQASLDHSLLFVIFEYHLHSKCHILLKLFGLNSWVLFIVLKMNANHQ